MFQDFSAKASTSGWVKPPAFEAAELIQRYPNLSEIELARLINLYRAVAAVDLALMISDARLGPKLERFFKDHQSKVRTPFRQYAALVGIAVLGIAITLWALGNHS